MTGHTISRLGGGLVALAAIIAPQSASAQFVNAQEYLAHLLAELPNSGDAQIDLYGNFQTLVSDHRYRVEGPAIELANLSESGIIARTGVPNLAGNVSIRAVTNVSGTLLHLAYEGRTLPQPVAEGPAVNPAAGTALASIIAVSLICKSTVAPNDPGYFITPSGVTRTASDIYGAYFTGSGYADNYSAYRAYLRGENQPTGYTGTARPSASDFRQSVYECGVRENATNPLVGTSNSLQARMVQDALDFTAPIMPALSMESTDWGVGLRVGQVAAEGHSGVQVDGLVNRSWRIGTGTRALITLEVPFSYRDVQNNRDWRVYAAASAALPVSRHWTATPRIAFGFANAIDQEIKGQMLSVSLTNAYRIDRFIGRGSLTLANLVGYTRVVHMEYVGKPIGTQTANYAIRSGFAWDYPMPGRVFGRQATVRYSYAYTYYGGDELYARNAHEVTTSLGVRGREATPRNRFETLRLGLMARLGRGYKSAFVFTGIRF